MSDELLGHASFMAPRSADLFDGRLRLSSDGRGRSEVIVSDPAETRLQRLVFSNPATWWPLYQLIQVIQEVFERETLAAEVAPEGVCELCSGLGGTEDDEGNWVDCPNCKLR